MSVKYAGQNLLVETDEVQNFIQRHLSLDDLRHIAPPHEYEPSPNYDRTARPIRFNSLYWPTGATRWGTFYGLANTATKTAISNSIATDLTSGSGTGTANLVFELTQETSGNKRTVTKTASMFLLPPRQITASGEDLWIIPLVDQRYWWQFKHSGDITVLTSTTWDGLYTTLGTQLGVTISADTVGADYLIPDPEQLSVKYANAAAVLDSVAHSVGQRIVVALDGTVQAQGWTIAKATVVVNDALPANVVAGKGFSLEHWRAPAAVLSTFRELANGSRECDFGFYTSSVGPTAAQFNSTNQVIPNTVKRIESTAYADTTISSTPANQTALDDLATQIAFDYYESLARQYDITLAALENWTPSAYDDCIIWEVGRLEEPEYGVHYRAHTRAQTAPHNFGLEIQLSQDSTLNTDTSPPGDHHIQIDDESGNSETINSCEILTVIDTTFIDLAISNDGSRQLSATLLPTNLGIKFTADSGGVHVADGLDTVDYVGTTNIITEISTDSGDPEILSVTHTLVGDLFTVTHDSGTPDATFNVGVAENWTLQGLYQLRTRTTTDNESEFYFEPQWAQLDAGQTLQPGGSVTGKLLVWGGSSFTPTGAAITIEDHFSMNCLHPGEQVPVTQHFDRNETAPDNWEIVGAHGLTQEAKATSTITAGSTGTATVYIDDPLVASAIVDIPVHLKWMHGGQDISNDKEIQIRWNVKAKIWRIPGAQCED